MEKKEVFISYHTNSSKDMVRQISAVLEGAGISCWYAPRDVEDDSVIDYATAIVKAIRECRVFLLILNKEANLSENVRNEIHCAFERFSRHEDITLLPFRIDECVLSDVILYYLGRMHIMDGSIPPELLRIQELVERILIILGKKKTCTRILDKASTSATMSKGFSGKFSLTNSMIYPDSHFIGRKQELEACRKILSGVENKLFLVGMGGIGKSEIAKMYLKLHAMEYEVVLWVSFSETLQQTIADDYAFPIQGFQRQDYPEDDERSYFLRKLQLLKEIADQKIMIVIDNFDVTEDDDLEKFCSGRYSVIFTTRYHQTVGNIPEVPVLPITNKEEWMELFQTEYMRMLSDDAYEQIKELLELLDGHPLSIRLVASAMQKRRISPEKMLLMLKQGEEVMRQKNMKAAEIIYGRLHQMFQISGLSPEEKEILKTLAIVPLRGIEVEELFDWCKWEDYEVIDGLIQKSWVIHNPVSDKVHLHPLISELFLEELRKIPDCCENYVKSIIKECYEAKNYTWQRVNQIYEFVTEAAKKYPEGAPFKEQLLERAGTMAMDIQKYEESIGIFMDLMERADEDAKKPFLYHKISHIQLMSGHAEESARTAWEGYELLNTLDFENMPIEVKYMKKVLIQRLGEVYRALGKYDEAIEYGRQAIMVCDQYEFKDPELSKGWAVYHLAETLLCAGKPKEAIEQIYEAIRLFEIINDRWSLAFCYLILSKIFLRFGEHEQAMEYLEKAWEIQLPHSGEKSTAMAGYCAGKGDILADMGETNQANQWYNRAAETYRTMNFFKREQEVLGKIAPMSRFSIR